MNQSYLDGMEHARLIALKIAKENHFRADCPANRKSGAWCVFASMAIECERVAGEIATYINGNLEEINEEPGVCKDHPKGTTHPNGVDW